VFLARHADWVGGEGLVELTETLPGVSPCEQPSRKTITGVEQPERAAVRELVRAARARGEDLTGPEGLLKTITATVLESALEEEMSGHLGFEKYQGPKGGGNIRNGTRSKTVLTEAAGEVQIEVPRDRAGTFEPQIVKKRQRRLNDVDAVAISLYAKGLTTGEISAHFAEVYGASVSKDTVSRITDRVVEEMQVWTSRPLLPIYAAVFVDAIYVKVRDGQVGNRPFYAAIGVDLDGRRDVLGLWAGAGGGESAKFWMNILTDLRNRGITDVFFLVCDGLKGLPDAVGAVFPATIVQACVIHLIRATLRYASRKYWDHLARDLRTIYTAPTAEAAWAAFEELEEQWAKPYPAIGKLWRAAWTEFVPFLDYDVEIRRVLFSTNAIESLHARYRRAVGVRGHFPTEQAALKCLYLVTRGMDPKGTGQARWATRWKPALNAFAVTFADRMPAAENL
jgi:putative transposase